MPNFNFQKVNVNAGEPLTAQAWNALVNGLFDVQAYLNAVGGTAHVTVSGTGVDAAKVRVTALVAGVPTAIGINATESSTDFVFRQLPAGSYDVQAEAAGFQMATGKIAVDGSGTVTPQPLALTLTPNQVVMPSVLGKRYADAAALLSSVNPVVLDIEGVSLPLVGFDSSYSDSPVLTQYPEPGCLVLTGSNATKAQIVVARTIKIEPFVLVPSLVGLTFAAASAKLSAIGLNIQLVY